MPRTTLIENSNNVENQLLPNDLIYHINPYTRTSGSTEKKRGVKMTIPDQSLTIKQILDRHTRGLRTPDQVAGYYDQDYDPLGLDGINIETLDLSQKYEILNGIRSRTRDLKKRHEKQQKDAYDESIRSEALKHAALQPSA